jgi:hypothetical protein
VFVVIAVMTKKSIEMDFAQDIRRNILIQHLQAKKILSLKKDMN